MIAFLRAQPTPSPDLTSRETDAPSLWTDPMPTQPIDTPDIMNALIAAGLRSRGIHS
jgi:hypothetical protein